MKLGYWGIQGLCEPIRYLIASMKEFEIEEKKYSDFDEWFKTDKPELQKKNRFANLPYLVLDDADKSVIVQSSCILAFLGRKAGLAPKSEEETIKMEMMVGVLEDLWQAWMKLMFSKEKFEELKAPTHDSLVAKYADLAIYLSNHKFIAGDNLTYADFKAVHYFNITSRFSSKLKAVPEVQDYIKRVLGAAGIQEAFDKANAETPFMPPNYGSWANGCPKAPNDMVAEF